MRQKHFIAAALAPLALLSQVGLAQSNPPQTNPQQAGPPARADLPNGAAAVAEQDARFARWKKALPAVTGPHRVVREEVASLPSHTIFRPAVLGAGDRFPVIAFANGGCRNTPIEFTSFLAELASHGYFIIADGTDDVPFATTDFGLVTKDGKPYQIVARKMLTGAVDWAAAQNADAKSPYFHKLDVHKIAYMGQSCGGMQALSASTDPRTTTTVVLNSGRFDQSKLPPGHGQFSEQFEWSELHAPIAFFEGGPNDIQIAHENFEEITTLPVFLADLPVGHVGAYPGPDPRWTKAILGWLNWQLKSVSQDRAMFVGEQCGLCRDRQWTVTGSKNLN